MAPRSKSRRRATVPASPGAQSPRPLAGDAPHGDLPPAAHHMAVRNLAFLVWSTLTDYAFFPLLAAAYLAVDAALTAAVIVRVPCECAHEQRRLATDSHGIHSPRALVARPLRHAARAPALCTVQTPRSTGSRTCRRSKAGRSAATRTTRTCAATRGRSCTPPASCTRTACCGGRRVAGAGPPPSAQRRGASGRCSSSCRRSCSPCTSARGAWAARSTWYD